MADVNATAVPDIGLAGLKMAGGLFLLLALIFLGFYLLKRYGHRMGLPSSRSQGLSLQGQLSLGPKKGVAVVRFLNKYLVLGVTDTHITKLAEMDAEHEQDHTDFSETLSRQTARQNSD
ncbi:MAG: flagellar biosynthetic protein FliO [Desulfovibrionales bacterium]